ncbi:MAG: hypothetical protein ACLGHC_01840 [Alphaproteobacteria bacterium]
MTAAALAAAPEPVRLRRTFDPTLLNEVVNHPDVRPFMAPGDDPIDLAPLVSNPANFALVTEGGGFLLHCHEPGIYEVHSQFLPEHRFRTRDAMRAGFDYMFTRTDCERVVTQVPDNNGPAASLAKAAGFRPMFRREKGLLGSTEYMGLSVEDWAQANADLEADGDWFHEQCEAAVKAVRPDIPDHPHDPAHDRAVGAAVRMIRAGNTVKGVAFYNRWARLAGYTPIRLLSLNPPTLDMSEDGLAFIVQVSNGTMEILQCQ